jgi:hypothetical protein
MKRLRVYLAGASPAMLVGAFFALALSRLGDAQGTRIGLLLFGALYGLAVVGLIRLFRVAPWGAWLAGLVCGPVPAALLVRRSMESGERQGLILFTAVLGLLIGGIEHARRHSDGS